MDELTAQLQHAALDNAGEESLLVCLSQAEEIVAEAIAAGRLHAQHAVEDVSRQQHQQQEEAQRQAVGCALMHVVIWCASANVRVGAAVQEQSAAHRSGRSTHAVVRMPLATRPLLCSCAAKRHQLRAA